MQRANTCQPHNLFFNILYKSKLVKQNKTNTLDTVEDTFYTTTITKNFPTEVMRPLWLEMRLYRFIAYSKFRNELLILCCQCKCNRLYNLFPGGIFFLLQHIFFWPCGPVVEVCWRAGWEVENGRLGIGVWCVMGCAVNYCPGVLLFPTPCLYYISFSVAFIGKLLI